MLNGFVNTLTSDCTIFSGGGHGITRIIPIRVHSELNILATIAEKDLVKKSFNIFSWNWNVCYTGSSVTTLKKSQTS